MRNSFFLKSLFQSSVLAASLMGCGTNNDDASESLPPESPPANITPELAAQSGRMELRLVDAPADDVKEIVVTITKITVHGPGGGWTTLLEKEQTIDLLKLNNGPYAVLGIAQMPPGRVTQMRLYVKETGPNYVVTPDGMQHPLKVPSGVQSGIKIKIGEFDWPACANGQVTIDFDGKKSIFVHPKGKLDEWNMRPVVRLKAVVVDPGKCPTPTPAPTPDAGVPTGGAGAPGGAAGAPGSSGGAGTSGSTPPSGPTEPPIVTTPPPDACGGVVCPTTQYCHSGECRTLIP